MTRRASNIANKIGEVGIGIVRESRDGIMIIAIK
jgi:hypothetical protein